MVATQQWTSLLLATMLDITVVRVEQLGNTAGSGRTGTEDKLTTFESTLGAVVSHTQPLSHWSDWYTRSDPATPPATPTQPPRPADRGNTPDLTQHTRAVAQYCNGGQSHCLHFSEKPPSLERLEARLFSPELGAALPAELRRERREPGLLPAPPSPSPPVCSSSLNLAVAVTLVTWPPPAAGEEHRPAACPPPA